MIKVYKDSKVYVASPAAIATGGPELLHQLVFHLRNSLNIDAYMFYYPNNHPNPIHPEYKAYNNNFVREIEDNEENILIVPEIKSGLDFLEKYKKIRKIIWWLGVDNFYLSHILSSKKNFFFRRTVNKIIRTFFQKDLFDINEIVLRRLEKQKLDLRKFKIVLNADFYLVQSFHAKKHLEKIGISKEKTFYLSDYLNQDFLNIQTDISKKENIVVYNPKKGFGFTKKIIQLAPDIRFIPLINMTRQKVIETLQRAKVYIDFGNHSGKDRIPRESAILGCCVITGKRGCAAYFEDVSIPEVYKFEDKEENIKKIIEKIKDCFENFEERYKDFDYYRKVIKKEPDKFVEDMKKIFVTEGR